MKSELFSLSRLFTETLFRIPDYQRGYAWTDKQIRDFWNDIDQLEEGTNHYAGVLTLEQVPKIVSDRWEDDIWIIESKSFQPFYVVDGQQRLTTAMILLQVIIEKMADADRVNYTTKDEIRKKFLFESRDGGISRSYLFGYEKDNPSYEFLKQRIFMERSDAHSVGETTIYTKNLLDAKTFFVDRLSEMDLSELERLYHKLTQSLLFNSYVIASDIDVFVTFETMNNRGKLLSVLELLKNRLIYLSTKLPDSPSERRKLRSTINECWKTTYHYLGRSEDGGVDDDVFLERHYRLYFGALEVARLVDAPGDEDADDPDDSAESSNSSEFLADEYDEFLLEKHFVVKNTRPTSAGTPLTLHSLYEYAHSIKSYVEADYRITHPLDSGYSDSETRVLSQIGRIADDGPEDDIYLLVLALFSPRCKSTPAKRVEALSLIENILFVHSLGWYRIDGQPQFEPEPMALRLTAGSIDIEGAVNQLKSYISKRNKRINPGKMFGWWAQKPLGFYTWRAVKYLMFEYEQMLRASSKTDREKLNWSEFVGERKGRDYSTIEHILPQKVTHEYWKEMLKGYSVRERNMLKHTIGNLLPASRPKNAALGNRSFPEKRSMPLVQSGYAYGCYSENEIAQEAEWTPRHIVERSVKMLTFIEDRWGIHIGTKKEKIEMLGLEFVK